MLARTFAWSATLALLASPVLADAEIASKATTGGGTVSYSVSLPGLAQGDGVYTFGFVRMRTPDWMVGTGGQEIHVGSGGLRSGGGNDAPVTSSGAPYADRYLYVTNDGWQVAPKDGVQQYFGILWGSASATDTLTFRTGAGNLVLTGKDILAAAADAGFAGYGGSYYVNVSFEAVGGFSSASMRGTWVDEFRFAQMSWSQSAQSITSAPSSPALPSQPPIAEAPAPTLGASTAGSLLSLCLLPVIGLGRVRTRLAATTHAARGRKGVVSPT